jgi:integrase
MRARYRRDKVYYYLDTGESPRREISLGQDYVEAVRKWAELTIKDEDSAPRVTFRMAAERYLKEVLPTKAPRTQKDNLAELAWLYRFYDDPPIALDDIEPVHVGQYLAWRVKEAVEQARLKNAKRVQEKKAPLEVKPDLGHVRANREKALFSHIWNFARQAGLTRMTNPCAGIRGHSESGRDVYVEDEVYQVVWEHAEPALRDVLDLAYLTGQRPADVRKITKSDIKDGWIAVEQNKTGKRLRLANEGALAELLAAIARRPSKSLMLLNNDDGYPISEGEVRRAFDRARKAAAAARPDLAASIKEYQIRDLRAKAGTDKEEAAGMQGAQDQLGHATQSMTLKYVRHRRGKLVKPTR